MPRSAGKVAPALLALILTTIPAFAEPATPAGPVAAPIQKAVVPAPKRIAPSSKSRALDAIRAEYFVSVYSAVTAAVISAHATANSTALIGPSFDRQHPGSILRSALADQIGKTYKPDDTVSFYVPPLAGVGLIGLIALDAGLAYGGEHKGRYAHDGIMGLLESMAVSWLATEALKAAFGRLRPDFQDRYRFYLKCQSGGGDECKNFRGDVTEASDLYHEGRVSFPSGHTSMSFAVAGYGALLIGGRFVWGEGWTVGSAIGGAFGQAALLVGAGLIGVSRVNDHRHNPTDVFAGMTVGLLTSNLAYWRRFDRRGKLRRSDAPDDTAVLPDIDLTAGPGDVGLAMRAKF